MLFSDITGTIEPCLYVNGRGKRTGKFQILRRNLGVIGYRVVIRVVYPLFSVWSIIMM